MNFSPALPVDVKPRLRGVFHQYAFFVSLVCGIALILAASDGRARLAAVIYAFAVSALLGTSALYHRVTWRPRARRWMRRLDHSMIFVLIAGTYTPVALLALKGSLANAILIVLWAGALGGVVFKLVWIDAPKWLFAAVYVALGLVTAAVMGELPADLAGHIASGKYPETIYVRVSKDGLADDAFADVACSKKIEDAYLESVVRSIRFKPALDGGKPVDGVASLNLRRLGT